MNNFRINFYLQKKKTETAEYCTLLISVVWPENRLRMSLKQTIEEKFWDKKKQRLKASAQDPIKFNNKLDEIRNTLNNYYIIRINEKQSLKLKEVQNLVSDLLNNKKAKIKSHAKAYQPELSFFEHFEKFIIDSKAGIRLPHNGKPIQSSTIKTYNTTKKHLSDFIKKNKLKLDFDDINEKFFSEFRQYMSDQNLSNNSQGRHFKVIKTFMHYTKDKGLHNNSIFIRKLIVFEEDSTIISLNEEELKKIEMKNDLPSDLEIVKDLFLIQVYSGIRLSDLFNLKPENINLNEKRIIINTIKTKEPLRIPITNKLKLILLKYNKKIPLIKSNIYNKALKVLGEKADINTPIQIVKYVGNVRTNETKPKYKLISSHTARRTFITISLKLGALPEKVMQITGHKSRKSFQRYVKITQEESIEEIMNLWDN